MSSVMKKRNQITGFEQRRERDGDSRARAKSVKTGPERMQTRLQVTTFYWSRRKTQPIELRKTLLCIRYHKPQPSVATRIPHRVR